MKIWEPTPPGTLWATPGLLRDSFILFASDGRTPMHQSDTAPQNKSDGEVAACTRRFHSLKKLVRPTVLRCMQSSGTYPLPPRRNCSKWARTYLLSRLHDHTDGSQ